MAQWDDGYVSDVDYTRHFYRETTPIWLATAALLLGQPAPDLTRPFRYADLGCAHGFTAITVAATCPQAEVWGFDFNPSHIESARSLAARAGVGNARFVETSFASLAAMPSGDLPEFDFIVTHGVLSWISPENRQRLIEVIGQRLRPGGLAYCSYNVDTGWSGAAALRTLMRMRAAAGGGRTDQTVTAVLDYLERLKAAGALFFNANPALESRLKSMREQDARYIAHEYLNLDWHPLMFADVSRAMADTKCEFIGSATLSENIDAVSVPAGVMPMLAEADNRTLRETLRDFGANQVFRRDIYRRGVQTVPMAEQHARLDDLRLAWTGQKAGETVTIATPLGSLTGRPELYRPLLAALETGPVSIRDVRLLPDYAGRPLVELLQVAALLIAGGFAHPVLPGGDEAVVRDRVAGLNRAISAINADGGDLPRLVAPLIGSVLNADLLEILTVGALLDGHEPGLEPLVDTVSRAVARSGRSMQRDGQPVSDPAASAAIIREALGTATDSRLPVLRGLGVLPA